MNEELIARLLRRYLALDIHKHYSVVAGANFEGQVVLEPVRIEHADLEVWLVKNIELTDYVVVESTTNAWHIYDLLEPLAEKVLVANPIKVKQIAQARVTPHGLSVRGEDGYPRHPDPGAHAGSQHDPGDLGATGARS